MSREEYLNQLHKYLRKLPRQDYEDAMEYFTEYFQETDEEGAEELMKELGTPKEAARELMANLLNKKIEDHQNYETDGQTRAFQRWLPQRHRQNADARAAVNNGVQPETSALLR